MLYAAITALSSSVIRSPTGQKNKVYELITFNQASYSRMLISNDKIGRSDLVGSVNICLIARKRYKIVQLDGFGFIITNDRIKLMVDIHH